MKTKSGVPSSSSSIFSSGHSTDNNLRLRELQGSFAIEGIHISDDELKEHAVVYSKLKQSGEAEQRIAKVAGKKR